MAAHKIYSYENGTTFRYSIRACNDVTNSLGNGCYQTAGGRNKAINKLLKVNPTWKKIRETPPRAKMKIARKKK